MGQTFMLLRTCTTASCHVDDTPWAQTAAGKTISAGFEQSDASGQGAFLTVHTVKENSTHFHGHLSRSKRVPWRCCTNTYCICSLHRHWAAHNKGLQQHQQTHYSGTTWGHLVQHAAARPARPSCFAVLEIVSTPRKIAELHSPV